MRVRVGLAGSDDRLSPTAKPLQHCMRHKGDDCQRNSNSSSFEEILWHEKHRGNHHFGSDPSGHGCLLSSSCRARTFSNGFSNTRAFTSEVPAMLRLIEACKVVSDPTQAHLFVVPLLMGTIMSMGWVLSHGRGDMARHAALFQTGPRLQRGWAWLRHLTTETLPRHLFFWGVDSNFLPHLSSGLLESPSNRSRGIFIHLGDVHYGGKPKAGLHPSTKQWPPWSKPIPNFYTQMEDALTIPCTLNRNPEP